MLTTSFTVMDKPVFVISLDLELGWGFILHPEDRALRLLRNDPQSGRGVVELLLELFERYNIPATWAAVGHLLLAQDDGKGWVSEELPQFKDGWLDWDFYSQIRRSSLYSAPDVIERILASPVTHEIGLHSFFHIPFSSCSQDVARLEVELGVNVARKWGIVAQSFVFPENYVGHTDALKEQGIKIYRSSIPRFHSKTAALLIRKAGGAIVKVMPPPVLPLWKEGIWELPGSMSFDAPLMSFTVLSRAKIGLERAVRANKVFHIWLHPWSLLQQKSLCLHLDKFLAFVAQKRDNGKLQVMTMGDLASYVSQEQEKRDVSS